MYQLLHKGELCWRERDGCIEQKGEISGDKWIDNDNKIVEYEI